MKSSSWGGGWFRPDIEGIRGVAVGMVLLGHAGVGLSDGGFIGIDLFFVVSGFLITALLLREFEQRGTISIPRFYARRIKRLLPAAAVVLVTIVIVSQILFSPVRNAVVSGDVLAAVGYFVNWRMAAQSVDYFAQGFEASPVQHFWSLAVEEQFYLVWPVTMLLVALVAVKVARSPRLALGGVVLTVGIASLIYSVQFTADSPTEAYFSTFTRVWELALGAFVAIARPGVASPRAAGALAWVGAIAVVGSFLAISDETPVPGSAALVPTLGLAAVIIAGSASLASMPMRVLSSAPFQYVGRISYSWYLWHWPVLIFAAEIFGELNAWEGALAVAVSWAPAALSYRFVEEPVRRSKTLGVRPRRAVAVLAVGSGAAALSALVLAAVQTSVPLAPASEVRGAEVLPHDRDVQLVVTTLRPEASEAFEDRTPLPDDGCFAKLDEVDQGECAYGDLGSDNTVVLFGDSHGEQYFPPLERLAEANGWRLVALTKSFCSPARIEQNHPTREGNFTDCEEWREQTIDRIVDEEDPSLIFVGGSTSIDPVADGRELSGEQARLAMTDGFISTFDDLRQTGARLALLTDVPKSPIDIPECVSEFPEDLTECTFPKPPRGPAIERQAARAADARLLDTTRAVCAQRTCRGVIGDAIVYRDRGHLTATFSATLAPMIERQLTRGN